MHDAERIYGIHQLLKESRRPVPLRRLAEVLQVSGATVKRELRFLRDRLQAPLQYDPDGKGYRYDPRADSFELPGLWFNADELLSLLAASQLFESVQPGLLEPQIAPLRERIAKILDKTGHRLESLDQRILLKTSPRRPTDQRRFDAIASAVLHGKALEIHYHGRGRDQQSQRRVHPHRLLHYRDNWYLIAWCEVADDLRIFSLDRIRQSQPQDIPFKPMDSESLDRFTESAFGIFAGETRAWAELRFTAERARWVAEEIWHPQQRGEWKNGHYHLFVPYANPTEIALEIMKYGPEVEVLGPPELRQDIANRHQRASRLYQEKNFTG
jgi:predicted DNA-binding transcriptional regulator YafY